MCKREVLYIKHSKSKINTRNQQFNVDRLTLMILQKRKRKFVFNICMCMNYSLRQRSVLTKSR